jgi:hypothetical protein
MPKIVAAGFASAFTTNVSAHHYRFVGLEITTNYAARDNSGLNLVSLDTGATSTPQLPKDIVIDRCYIHGTPTGNVRRGIALNSARTAVVDSYLSDFHEDGSDSQAIVSWNSPGPIKLVNNYLEGAAENLMFGGADPGITSLVPSDIEIRRNHFFKPLSWKENEPTYAGIPWVIKNLFELKNAQRVLVDGNIFENNWVEDQAGFAIQLTVRNEDGTAPWSTVRDVTFTHNIVRHTASGVNFLGLDTNNPSTLMRRVWIRDNVWDDLGTPQWGENAGRLFQPLNGAADITIEHNTAFQTGAIIFADLGPFPGFTYRDNLTPENEGTVGSGTARGIPTLNAYFPGAVYVKNVQAGGPAASYPAGNFFPASLAAVGFVNLAGGNYRLLPSSLYKNAGTDGKDIGADIDAVQAATGGTPTASAPSSDFNGDGLADILWRDQGSTGLIAAWLMNGASRMAATLTTPNSFPLLNWQIVGTGDFNGDGKPDILWRDTASTGLLAVWHMDGTTLTSAAATNPPSFPLLNWRVVGVGDFNGDGKPDILWREQASTGQIAIWYMNGVNLTSAVLTNPSSLPLLNWKIVGPK